VVTDEGLELISKSFKNFKVLVLSSCEGFSTEGLAAIAANCRFGFCLFLLGLEMVNMGLFEVSFTFVGLLCLGGGGGGGGGCGLGGGSSRTNLDLWSNAVLVLREMRERFFIFYLFL
jgi:hypothetical protein